MSIFSGISGITYNGDSGKASLGLTLPNGFLENLASKSDTFSYMRTSANSNMTIQNGYASAYYAILKLIPTGVYSTSLSYDNMTKSDIRVDLDKILTVNYEIDRLDSNRSVENYQAGAQASAALTIRKTLNAHFLGLWATEIQSLTADNILVLENIANPDAATADVTTDWKAIRNKITTINKTYDTYGLGCEFSAFSVALCTEGWNNVLDLYEARPTQLGDNVAINGRKSGIFMKSGLPVILDDMLKNKLTVNTSGISKTYTYDFTNILGFVAHQNVLAYPFRILEEVNGINRDNHRNWYGREIQLGFKIIRPSKQFVITDVEDFEAYQDLTIITVPNK